MKNLLTRTFASLQSFFPEAIKSFRFAPSTPFSRLEYVIHSLIILLFLYLIRLVQSSGNQASALMANLFLLIVLLAVCFIPMLRIMTNRVLDLKLGFNDDKTLQFTPKRFLLFLGICFVLILIFSLQVRIDVEHNFFGFSSASNPQIDLRNPSNVFFIFLTSFCLALANISLNSLLFPSKSLNIFENIAFSSKTKEFAFYAFIGLLPLCIVFYLGTLKVDKQNTEFFLIGIGFLTSCVILLSKNFYARYLLLTFLFVTLQEYYNFASYGHLFSHKDWYPNLTPLFLAFILLTCRKNFILALPCIFGLVTLDTEPFALLSLVCLYFVLIVDFFDFKKSKDFVYSSLWAISISTLFVFGAPLLQIPLPLWMKNLPPYLLLILISGVFMGLIYLNTYIKNKPNHQLLVIFALGFLLNIAYFFPEDFKNFFPFSNFVFTYILLTLIFWIVSNDSKISSAYKLAILSTLTLVFFPLHSLVSKDSGLLLAFIKFVPFSLMLILSYLFYKVKSPFRAIIFLITLLSFIFAIHQIIISILLINGYIFTDDIKSLQKNIFVFINIAYATLFLLSGYIFYKHKDSFNPNLTMQ